MEKKFIVIGIISIILISTVVGIGFFFFYDDILQEDDFEPSDNQRPYWRTFNIGTHNFSSIAYGEVNNTYFPLEIGYQIVLEGTDVEGAEIQTNITVLNQTEDIGGIETRVVEERELEDGELIEVSYNYMAICNETKDIIYFGELSIEYEDGEIVGYGGSWRADQGVNKPGILFPGEINLGDGYYQEFAPEEALDRGRIINTGLTYNTPVGLLHNCVVTEDTTPLEPLLVEYKVYAPGVGQIADETLVITKKGYVPV